MTITALFRLSPTAPLEEAGELVAEIGRDGDNVRILCLSGKCYTVSSNLLIEE